MRKTSLANAKARLSASSTTPNTVD